jgi:hypothetical protein
MFSSLLVPCNDNGREETTREEQFVGGINIQPFGFGFFCQRARAALVAILWRSSLESVINRRFPPILPPLRPIAAMYSEMFAVTLGGVSRDAVDDRLDRPRSRFRCLIGFGIV